MVCVWRMASEGVRFLKCMMLSRAAGSRLPKVIDLSCALIGRAPVLLIPGQSSIWHSFFSTFRSSGAGIAVAVSGV